MAKPAITKRITKGSALTYSELDTNFQNIIDSILTVTDGTSDINLELIDTLEITGDHNIKITATPSGNLVTIDNEIPTYTKEPSGFPNLTETTISFNNGSRKFTITPTGASFRVWVAGEEFVKTAFEEITITNTTGLYSIYYDSTGQLGAKTSYVTYSTETPVAQVYWNATLGVGRLAEQRHGIAMDWATHEYLHRTRGAAYASGLAISNYTILGDGSVNSHAQFDLSSGVFFDEDLRFNITHSNTPTANFEQDLQGPARIPVVYHSGSTGEWTFDTATDYAVKVGTIAKYNLNTAGTWTTPDITSTHYVAMWIVATNFITEPIVAIMGQRTDNKLEDAENNNTWAGLDLTNFPSEEFRPLYRIIFRSATSYTNAVKSYIAEVTDYRQTALGAGSGVALQANSFGTVSVSGQSDVIADQVNDALTLVAGTGITLTTDAATDSVTISSSSGGTVNTGVANALAYYPSAGTTVDDTLLTYGSAGGTQTVTSSGNFALSAGSTGSNQVRFKSTALNLDRETGSAIDAKITTAGTFGLTLDTNGGTTSASIQIQGGVTGNADIVLTPAGTGDVLINGDTLRLGDANVNATLTTNGTSDLILNTNSGSNSGSITIADGTNADITIDPNGTGRLIIDNTNLYFNAGATRSTIRSSGRLTLEAADGGNAYIEIGDQDSDNDIALIPGPSGQVNIISAITELGPSSTGGNVDLRLQAANNLRLTAWSAGLVNGAYITIASGTDANITLTPNGTGDVLVSADTLKVGDGNADATITSIGTGDLILNTNSGTNSGSITIADGTNGNITIAPNGTGQIDLNGLLKVANNTATPVNINQPISYLQVTVPVSARSAKTITANGNAASSATQSKFGGGSVALDGTGDYLSITTQDDFGFGTSDFTIEAWAYKSTASQQVFIDTRTASTQVSVYVESNAAGNLRLFVNGSYQLTSSNAMSTTTWQHIAISRCGGITRFFINGVVSTNIYTDTNDYGTTKPANIGASWTGGTAWNGYLDDIRITKGVGRYETSFIPPTVALKNDIKTVLLVNGNTNITDDVTDNSTYYLPLYQ